MIKNKTSFKDWNQMSANESIREARLQSLKDAIEAGTYRLDNRVLADSLLDKLLQEQWKRLKIKKQ
jgi:anti-sigma28 factor (negative regulator of flagellin synthesis)